MDEHNYICMKHERPLEVIRKSNLDWILRDDSAVRAYIGDNFSPSADIQIYVPQNQLDKWQKYLRENHAIDECMFRNYILIKSVEDLNLITNPKMVNECKIITIQKLATDISNTFVALYYKDQILDKHPELYNLIQFPKNVSARHICDGKWMIPEQDDESDKQIASIIETARRKKIRL